MVLSAFEWILIGGAATLAIGLIGFFLKRTMSRVDRHEEDIGHIKQTSATQEDLAKHEKDINHIKLTYVTKSDLEKMEGKLETDIRRLNVSVSEIKDKVLFKTDFYRSMNDLTRSVEKLHDMYVEDKRGGKADGC